MKESKEAYSTINFLFSLLSVCILLTTLGFIIKTINITILKNKSIQKEHELMNETLNKIFIDLKNQKSYEADSQHDFFWKWDKKNINNIKINIIPLSGKININFFPTDIIEKTDLKDLFINPSKAASIINNSEQLFYSYDSIKEFLNEENFKKYFTFYGWANYNTIDQDKLKLFLKSLDISLSSSFFSTRKSLLLNKQYIQTYTEFRMKTGTNYKKIMPYINIDRPLNVNFTDQFILKNILSYPPFKIDGVNSKVNTIIRTREYKEITQEILSNILGLKNNNLLNHLLGVKSYFYQIELQGSNEHCIVVIAREVTDTNLKNIQPKWYILEKNWQ